MERSLLFVPDPNPSLRTLWRNKMTSGICTKTRNTSLIPAFNQTVRLTEKETFSRRSQAYFDGSSSSYIGYVYVFLQNAQDTLRTALALQLTQDKKHRGLNTYLEARDAQNKCFTGVNFPCCLDFECPQGNFLRALCAADCLKKTWRQELENSCFYAQVVGVSHHPKQPPPPVALRALSLSHRASLFLLLLPHLVPPLCLCVFLVLWQEIAVESRAFSSI